MRFCAHEISSAIFVVIWGVLPSCGAGSDGNDHASGDLGGSAGRGGSDPSGGHGGSAGQAEAGTSGSGGQPSGSFTLGQPETLAANLPYPNRITLNGDNVYWTNYGDPAKAIGSVMTMPKAGGSARTLATGEKDLRSISVHDGLVYWVAAGFARYVLLPDGTPKDLSSSGGILDLLLDDDGTFYSYLQEPTSVGSAVAWTMNSGEIALLPSCCASQALGLVRDPARQSVFVIEPGAAQVHGWRLSDQGYTLVASGLSRPAAMVVGGERAFITLPDDGRVISVPLTGDGSEDLATGQDHPWGIAADSVNVYLANLAQVGEPPSCGNGTLNRIPLPRGPVEVLASGLKCPARIAVDDSGVYWVNNGNDSGSDGSIMRIPKFAH
jgi:hypothetical protein